MNKIMLITTGIALSFLTLSCRKEHVSPVNQLVKDLFCFKEGSEWVYYDSVSHSTQTMTITNYEATRLAGKTISKTYDWAELIIMNITIENIAQSLYSIIETELFSDEDKDNTLAHGRICSPAITTLFLRCNEKNNFTPTATYLNSFTVNETVYHDVYMFNIDDIKYYIAKHIGFIRCVGHKYDWVLIDKNIQQ